MSSDFRKWKTGEDLPDIWLPSVDTHAPSRSIEADSVCVIYARYSTQTQREASIERQVEDCQRYMARHGLRLIDTYADRGVTGTTDERAALNRLREDAKRGRFTNVVVESLDRIARKLTVAVKIFEELLDLGIVLHDAEEDRPLSIMDIGHKGAASQAARDLLVKRGQAGIRRNAAAGSYGNAHCFGYERAWDPAKNTLIWRVKPSEAALIVEAFQLFVSGVSAKRIADIFNKRPYDERGARDWSRNFLSGSAKMGTGLLRRIRYVGLRIHGRVKLTKSKDPRGKTRWRLTLHPRSHWTVGVLDESLSIIDRELFDAAQAILKKRSDAYAKRTPWSRFSANSAPLQGLFRCAHCGGGMTPSQKRQQGTPRLICNRARNNNGCKNTHSFALEQVEDEIHSLLADHLASTDSSELFTKHYNSAITQRLSEAATQRATLERARRHLISHMNRIRDDERQRRFPIAYLEQERLKANEEYERIEQRLAELMALERLASRPQSPATILEGRQMLLGSLSHLFSNDFDSTSESGTKLKAALRNLIHSIVLDIGSNGCSLLLKCRVLPALPDDETNLVVLSVHIKRAGGKWQSSVRQVRRVEELATSGARSLTDQEWQQISHLVPQSVGMSRRRIDSVDPRMIVDAALLHLWEGVPLSQMPSTFGPAKPVFAALKRLSETGGWDAIIEKLREIAPNRVPEASSNMFPTKHGRRTTSLKGLPLKRAENGTKAAAGLHAPTDQQWEVVRHLIPEQALQANKSAAPIETRTFLHGLLFWLNEDIPLSHLPLMFGSERLFNAAIRRLAGHGLLDDLLQTLTALDPSPLAGANLSRLDRFPRDGKKSAIWRRALPKQSDLDGIPAHSPDDNHWRMVQHLFPPELLLVNDKVAVKTPRRLAHAILYRIKEKIPFEAMPQYFGISEDVKLVATKWVAHHLWDEFKRIFQELAPEVLLNADLTIFDTYRRSKRIRYRHLIEMDRRPIPPHLPSTADFELVKDLIPDDILCIRGGPAVMDAHQFFHAIVYMLKEKSLFGRLPLYFGSNYDIRVITRRLVFHHYWDAMKARVEHFRPDWSEDADLSLFDSMKRSSNPDPVFRRRPDRRQK